MTLISSQTSQVLLTHRVIRNPDGTPKAGPDGKPVRAVKANLENLNVTEWRIVTPPGVTSSPELGSTAPACSVYRYLAHDARFSAEGEPSGSRARGAALTPVARSARQAPRTRAWTCS